MQDFWFWSAVVIVSALYLYNWGGANETAKHFEGDKTAMPVVRYLTAYYVLYFGLIFTVILGALCLKWCLSIGIWKGRSGAFAVAGGAAFWSAIIPALILNITYSNAYGKFSKYTYAIARFIIKITKPQQYMQIMLPTMLTWAIVWGAIVKFELPEKIFAWVVAVSVVGALIASFIPDFAKLNELYSWVFNKFKKKENAAAGGNQQQQAFSLYLGQTTGFLAQRGHSKGLKQGLQVRLSQTDAATNMLIFGGIGAGKTTRVINPVMQQLMSQNCGGLIFDIKSDFKREANYFAEKAGRKIITIGVGQRGINLLKGLSPEKAGTFLKSAFILESGSVGQNAYWIDNAVNMCIGALGVLQQIPGKYSLFSLYEYVFVPAERQFLTAEVQTIAANLQKTDSIAAEKLRSYINRYDTHFGSLDAKTKGLIESTVSTVLVGFTHPDIKKGFCEDNDKCVEMQKVLDGTIYLVDLPLPIYGTTAKVIYMWTKLLWFNVMQQRRVQKEWNQDRPVFFLCDEYQEIIAASKTGDSDLNFWDKSRSSGAIGIISMQHISSLYSAIGNKDVANTIMANFRQKICFRTEDETTLQYFNKMLGKAELIRETINRGTSSSNGGINSSHNTNEQYYYQDVLDAQTMRQMDSDFAVAMLNINNVASDDILMLQPAFVPSDYQVPEDQQDNPQAIVKQTLDSLAAENHPAVLTYEKAYRKYESAKNQFGDENSFALQAKQELEEAQTYLNNTITERIQG